MFMKCYEMLWEVLQSEKGYQSLSVKHKLLKCSGICLPLSKDMFCLVLLVLQNSQS